MGTAIKHPVPDWVKPSCVIFDIGALWLSGLSTNILKHYWRHICFDQVMVLCDCLYKRLRHTITYLLIKIGRINRHVPGTVGDQYRESFLWWNTVCHHFESLHCVITDKVVRICRLRQQCRHGVIQFLTWPHIISSLYWLTYRVTFKWPWKAVIYSRVIANSRLDWVSEQFLNGTSAQLGYTAPFVEIRGLNQTHNILHTR